jgi:hypothetical protein
VSGERFLNRSLQSTIIKEFLRPILLPDEDRTSWFPTSEAINTIYNGTLAGSTARRPLVDMHVVMGVKDWMDTGHGVEAEFGFDVARAFFNQLNLDLTTFKDFRCKNLKVEDYC